MLIKTSGKKLWLFRYQQPTGSRSTNLAPAYLRPQRSLQHGKCVTSVRQCLLKGLAYRIGRGLVQQCQVELDKFFNLRPISDFNSKAKVIIYYATGT